ncbi:glucokinase [Sphingomonas sp. LY54]|uniref:glucokinase n=1 Tax=Sphingomonas sp. LY54 TaxID=3095343 RepID=UPI002D76E8B7|nr:glucokinase [Sphingomonas sp. LY54]WRP28016.1 glucokinase [Sphingomonas sp. LY54]
MTEVVAVDIGGTHARFAIARLAGGRVASLGEICTLKTADHASLQTAWEAFGRQAGRPLPPAAGIAIAGPIQGEVLKFTNNPWVIRPESIPQQLGTPRFKLVNDFGAVGHAVAQLDAGHFRHLCGPDRPLPNKGVISIVGPGTGLGVGQLLRRDGRYDVIETEGGHIDFAPLDPLEDRILAHLRTRYRRVSVERIASGMGLANIYEALAAIEGRPAAHGDEKALWTAALAGEDSLAVAALDRFFLALGAVAGDIALAQGAQAVVIAGGLGLRLADRLPRSGFPDRFVAKGRFERRMDEMPVKLITHPQPGLFGAAAAFAEEFGQ